jgi:hypothetical protein
MSDKGYLILAQNSNDDYVRLAYVLALSIKLTQTGTTSVSLVTDIPDAVPAHYRSVFDHIIEIPWFDDALESDWKIENRWKIYHVTPYDQTILLDADMLFLSDVSHWWDYLEQNHDLFICHDVMTYRNELVTDRFYRRAFKSNDLPDIYSAFTYFKKSETAELFWKSVETIAKNWQKFYSLYITEDRPKHLSMDVVFSLAIKLLGLKDQTSSPFGYPRFVHMKSRVQNWKTASEDWMEHAGVYLNKHGSLKIGNYQQSEIIHYTEKKFLNDYVLYVFEDLYKEKTNGSV